VQATHGIYEIPVKVLFSNSVEYIVNNYQFSYSGFNRAGYLKWEGMQMDPFPSRLLKGKLNFLWYPCIFYGNKIKKMSFFYINPFVEEKKCTLSVAYNFTN
jgi:hypothetical protein